MTFQAELRLNTDACGLAVAWVQDSAFDFDEAYEQCERADWMVWLAISIGVPGEYVRKALLGMLACALQDGVKPPKSSYLGGADYEMRGAAKEWGVCPDALWVLYRHTVSPLCMDSFKKAYEVKGFDAAVFYSCIIYDDIRRPANSLAALSAREQGLRVSEVLFFFAEVFRDAIPFDVAKKAWVAFMGRGEEDGQMLA